MLGSCGNIRGSCPNEAGREVEPQGETAPPRGGHRQFEPDPQRHQEHRWGVQLEAHRREGARCSGRGGGGRGGTHCSPPIPAGLLFLVIYAPDIPIHG